VIVFPPPLIPPKLQWESFLSAVCLWERVVLRAMVANIAYKNQPFLRLEGDTIQSYAASAVTLATY